MLRNIIVACAAQHATVKSQIDRACFDSRHLNKQPTLFARREFADNRCEERTIIPSNVNCSDRAVAMSERTRYQT
jgi:hypothetical protein